MTRKILIPILLLLFLSLFLPTISNAWEKVENCRVEQVGDEVHIYYDLRGDEEKYQVTIRGSADGGRTYMLPMKSLSGDVGKDIRPGRGKKIIWKALKDAGEMEGDAFVFEVEAVAALAKAFSNSIGMKFVFIPPGTFMMGSPSHEPGRDSDEKQHQVTLTKGFYMQTTEVTQGQWYEVMGTRPWSGKEHVRDSTNNPAVYISWNDCKDFIRRLNQKEGSDKYRMPTEAEWEYACRAGSTTRFYFGDSESSLGDHAWYRSNAWDAGEKYAHTVAQKQPNAWGLHGMHGNVWEWCQDWYGGYPSGSVSDPKGPSSGADRVLRGGSWGGGAGGCRSADRNRGNPGGGVSNLGFRAVRAY
jgi:formylglycine-generating enzyme required for sulfatase activity